MWTKEFARFVAPARARPQLWRLTLGVVVIGLCWGAASVLPFAALGAYGAFGGFRVDTFQAALMAGVSPVGTLLLLGTFGGLALGTILAARIHGRGLRSLIGRQQGRPFLVGIGAVAATTVVAALLPSALEVTPNLGGTAYLLFLGPALLALLLQTGAEELAFRGYLQTQLAARFRSPLVWLFLPGLLFGLLHWNPATHGPNAPVVVAVTTLVGWIAADLTRVSGGIGAAWGLHFANNAGGILAVGFPGPLGGLAAYHHVTTPADPALAPLMLVQLCFLVLAWALLRLWMRLRASG